METETLAKTVIMTLAEKLEQVKDANGRLQGQLDVERANSQHSDQLVEGKNRKITELNNQLHDAQTQLEQMQTQLKQAQDEAESLRKSNEELSKEIAEQKKKLQADGSGDQYNLNLIPLFNFLNKNYLGIRFHYDGRYSNNLCAILYDVKHDEIIDSWLSDDGVEKTLMELLCIINTDKAESFEKWIKSNEDDPSYYLNDDRFPQTSSKSLPNEVYAAHEDDAHRQIDKHKKKSIDE